MVLDKKQKILLISFIIIILATACLLYWNYSGAIIKTGNQEILQESTQFDFSVFQDPRLQELKNSGQDINVGQIGRENPFTPN
ncbi:MAG: hypothetical protein ABIG90_01250 [bacterium]